MISLKTRDFDYVLPSELIAQTPLEPRDHSRLLVLDRANASLSHHQFSELTDFLKSGDVLVFNNSRVIRARLFAARTDTGKKIEILLLRRLEKDLWETLLRSKKRVEAGVQIALNGRSGATAEITGTQTGGIRIVRFSDESVLPQIGEVPLPPYIHVPLSDPERYQTVYAEKEGSVAAPTAGLHFTPELLEKIKARGVECLFVTLHVGLNTFRPVRAENVLEHPIFPEYGVIDEGVAARINLAKAEQRRVICVGTTSVRLVESAAQRSLAKEALARGDHDYLDQCGYFRTAHRQGRLCHRTQYATNNTDTTLSNSVLEPFEGWANLFIHPGYRFEVTDALITNFHLPRSTLLMLVSALAGKELIFKAYREAIEKKYRFYSFGDAMMII